MFKLILKVILIVLVSTDLAIGAGGPQRRRDRKIPTAARLAQLRQRALRARARMQSNHGTSREGRNLSTEEDFIINERAERNLDNVKIHGSSLFGSRSERNLANVFPFVGGNRGLPRARLFGEEPEPFEIDHATHHDHHDDHGDHHDHHDHSDHHEHSDHPDHHDHHEHADHHDHNGLSLEQRIFNDFDTRISRQGLDDPDELSLGNIAAAGERCIDKVVMEEKTEYDDEITCKHSYSEKCHTTYTTDFEPQQEEVCEENFIKECFIEYKKSASQETVEFCYTPLVCEGEGPEECKTVYESQCETRYHEHEVEDDVVTCETVQDEQCEDVTQGYSTEQKCTKWPREVCTNEKRLVLKYSPETDCRKVPRELCGPSGCVLQPGPKECFDKEETVISEVPEETCNLEPQKTCKHVTKLVPLLKPSEECVDIPKEVCSRQRTNPRKVQRPVVKKWCYVPTEESGLN